MTFAGNAPARNLDIGGGSLVNEGEIKRGLYDARADWR